MIKLEEVYSQCQGSERFFKHKKVLFIGSESYDDPVITVLEGLNELGFDIYTIKKPNINSWFCNKIIDDPNELEFDFVLSSLHWGTRWSYYKKYNLNRYLKVLIDGDDNQNWKDWQEKYRHYLKKYVCNPPDEIKDADLMPYRWVEPLDHYNPDILFTSQKRFDDKESFYLPFGIHSHYYSLFQKKNTSEREYDFLHVPGAGDYRKQMNLLLRVCRKFKIIPGKIHISFDRSREALCDERLRKYVVDDENVHSWHRWVMSRQYFNALNNSKVLVYPGIDPLPFLIWDSKRPWEAYAAGCLVLMPKPLIDVFQYPLTQICGYAVYNSYIGLVLKCRHLSKNPSALDQYRKEAFLRAQKYFTPKPIANYFLKKIYDKK